MTNNDSFSILIVEDHYAVSRGLKTILSECFPMLVCYDASTTEDALYTLADHPEIQLLLTDLEIHNGQWAVSLISEVRAQHASVKIIVHSKFEEQGVLHQCLEAGANAYLSKSADELELTSCVREVIASGRYVTESERRIKDRNRRVVQKVFTTPEEKLHALTDREKEVCFLLYHGQSRKNMADQLFLSEETIKSHTKSLYRKLQIDSRAKLQLFLEVNRHLVGVLEEKDIKRSR